MWIRLFVCTFFPLSISLSLPPPLFPVEEYLVNVPLHANEIRFTCRPVSRDAQCVCVAPTSKTFDTYYSIWLCYLSNASSTSIVLFYFICDLSSVARAMAHGGFATLCRSGLFDSFMLKVKWALNLIINTVMASSYCSSAVSRAEYYALSAQRS